MFRVYAYVKSCFAGNSERGLRPTRFIVIFCVLLKKPEKKTQTKIRRACGAAPRPWRRAAPVAPRPPRRARAASETLGRLPKHTRQDEKQKKHKKGQQKKRKRSHLSLGSRLMHGWWEPQRRSCAAPIAPRPSHCDSHACRAARNLFWPKNTKLKRKGYTNQNVIDWRGVDFLRFCAAGGYARSKTPRRATACPP